MLNWWIDESYYPGPRELPRGFSFAELVTRPGHNDFLHLDHRTYFPLVPTDSVRFDYNYGDPI